ncbi:Outer membrane porin F precursor [Planctomycetes bacterium Pla163]|uniref:Outer membrane porin F n=1 Tax=Rohdeia mirabilis TaxID=2528008 RepID=A0A518D1S1_9BACT|nr:Outer membrane porin F precursor [Planctomycetes bacterium Pla163]
MATQLRDLRLRRSIALIATTSLLLVSTGCVSQQRYKEMSEDARFYQESYLDLRNANTQLEVELEDLRNRLDEAPAVVSTTEATAPPIDPAIDERMARLDELARRLGRAPGDVTTIDVEGGYGFALADSVVFPSGAAEPSPEGRAVLLELAADIASKPFDVLWVRGHTDNVPMRREASLAKFPYGNIQLSTVRALAVRDLLVTQGGLPEEKLFVAGFGPYLPVADNATPQGQQANRRVELVVLEAEGAEQP